MSLITNLIKQTRRLFCLIVLCSTSFPTYAADIDTAKDLIAKVITDFEQAIIEKDQTKFLQLFLHPEVTWVGVLSAERYAKMRQTEPDIIKATYGPQHTPASFIAKIAATKGRIAETFHNVKIDTDGTVASVSFDFTFSYDGKVSNAGREHWLLVSTAEGWKIAAVVWPRNSLPTT